MTLQGLENWCEKLESKYVKIAVLLFMALVLLPASVKANTCDTLFTNAPGNLPQQFGAITLNSTYNGMVLLAVTIITTMLTLLAIFYVIGRSFGIERVVNFVKTEYLETVLNFLILFFIFGGIVGIGKVVVVVSQLEGAAVSTLNTAGLGSQLSASTSTASSLDALYSGICNTYYNSASNAVLSIIELSLQNLAYNLIYTLNVQLMPAGYGITFNPFAGYTILLSAANVFVDFFSIIAIVETSAVFLLGFVYNLFPLFLFAGLVLRTLPWTRAIGGVFVALFISFYIVFPAIVYSFSAISYNVGCLPGLPCIVTNIAYFFGNIFTSALGGLGSIISQYAGTNSYFDIVGVVNIWVPGIVNGGFQIFGIIIAFIISFDLVEALGDLLGAPSLSSRSALSKIL